MFFRFVRNKMEEYRKRLAETTKELAEEFAKVNIEMARERLEKAVDAGMNLEKAQDRFIKAESFFNKQRLHQKAVADWKFKKFQIIQEGKEMKKRHSVEAYRTKMALTQANREYLKKRNAYEKKWSKRMEKMVVDTALLEPKERILRMKPLLQERGEQMTKYMDEYETVSAPLLTAHSAVIAKQIQETREYYQKRTEVFSERPRK